MFGIDDLEIQGDWDAQPLRDAWIRTPDLLYAFDRFNVATADAVAAGTARQVLEVAAAEGIHACTLAARGLPAFVLEPSPIMLQRARARQRRAGCVVPLVRGVVEAAPFRDGAFDRVLCDSALDHFADPDRAIWEMARVTAADGRLILTFVNYGSLTVRLSRRFYRLGRWLRLLRPMDDQRRFWDTPVPWEHTFECTLDNVQAMCAPYLELERAEGVSLGCRLPGWSELLRRARPLRRLLPWLDRVAARRPRLADYVVSVWRPKPRATWPAADLMRVRPTNPIHQWMIAEEARFWDRSDFSLFFAPALEMTRPARNRAFTGRADRDWLDDLAARGPVRRAAMLGGDVGLERRWLDAHPHSTLDIYEVSAGVLARARERLGDAAPRARLVQADLNFVELPEAAYDVVWSSDCLHAVVNLEHVLAQVARALRPGGLFALAGYVGEARMAFDPCRLARINAVLDTIPARFRLLDAVTPPQPPLGLSPFNAIRAPDLLPLVHARFEVVHEVLSSRLRPLDLAINWEAAARAGEAPHLAARLCAAEDEAASDPAIRPTEVYGVYRPSAVPELSGGGRPGGGDPARRAAS